MVRGALLSAVGCYLPLGNEPAGNGNGWDSEGNERAVPGAELDGAYQLLKDDLRSDKYDQIVQILAELKDYTVYHFGAKEEYMAGIRFPGLLSHKVEHSDFVEKINGVDLDAVDSNQDKYLSDLLEFVSDWSGSHILKTDRKYSPLAG